MHVLRSTYLPAYMSLVRQPYTSDPFPLTAPTSSSTISSSQLTAPLNSMQRETAVLDLYLSVKVREDVWADDSELHLEREESFKDLFDLMQPRARTEDLVRAYGEKAGVIAVESAGVGSGCASPANASFPMAIGVRPPASSSGICRTIPKAQHSNSPKPIPFSSLSVSFSTRAVGLVLTSRSGRRTIVEVPRSRRDESLETAAKRLVRELSVWVHEQGRLT